MRPAADVDRVRSLIEWGWNDREIAVATNIPRRTVHDWRAGRNLKRTRPSAQPSPGNGLPICHASHDFTNLDPAQYSYLLGVYLGDGCISRSQRVWKMRITLDTRYPEIIHEVARSLEVLMPTQHAYRCKRPGRCVELCMYSLHWPCFFPQHGPGRKHQRPIELTRWQSGLVASAHEWFLRGLIHSDGTRIVATERKGGAVRRAPRYAFSNLSDDIKRLFCLSCDALGVQWTRPSDTQIAVYRKASVARLDEFVGPKK